MRLLLVVIIAYLIGSIPFGYLIVRAKEGGDVRETGSGGTGATNVSRRAGKTAGVLTLILDALKGFIAIFVAAKLLKGLDPSVVNWMISAAAVAALLGHVFPVWLGFRGGKGVATGAGVFVALAPIAVLCAGVIFVMVVSIRKVVSLGSIAAAVTIPAYIWFQSKYASPGLNLTPLLTAAVVAALLIVYAHRENIARIWKGTEPRISDLKR
ncbi:MAG TPA: glycerol-3-phosphate 1-O-acyltransferase PlsY [Pyrinomonadaceae bacterium]|nr:glycerol-3-phosphate 1-O-acyltransferase PlsY [Pyrinomonadaceae bacterium]